MLGAEISQTSFRCCRAGEADTLRLNGDNSDGACEGGECRQPGRPVLRGDIGTVRFLRSQMAEENRIAQRLQNIASDDMQALNCYALRPVTPRKRQGGQQPGLAMYQPEMMPALLSWTSRRKKDMCLMRTTRYHLRIPGQLSCSAYYPQLRVAKRLLHE